MEFSVGHVREKTDVDEAERVQKRLKVKYNHMPVEPVGFFVLLFFNKMVSLIPLIVHNPPTLHWLPLKQTYILVPSFPLCLPPPFPSIHVLVHPTRTTR